MSLNDTKLTNQGTDVYPGVTNPIPGSNISDPYEANGVHQANEDLKKELSTKDVVEARPGIIESTQIEPLEKSTDTNWNPNAERNPSIIQTAGQTVAGAVQTVKEAVTGRK